MAIMSLLFILLHITAVNIILAEHAEVTIPVDRLAGADTSAILRRAQETQRHIDELVTKINDLRKSINDSDLMSRASNVLDRMSKASASLSNIGNTVQNINSALEVANLTSKIEQYSTFLKCFATSRCVTKAAPTTTTTTATASPVACESTTLTSSETSELANSPNYPDLLANYDCATKISAEVGNYIYVTIKTLTINGEAHLEISDFDTGELIKYHNTTYSGEGFNTHAKNVKVTAYAGYHLSDGISYSIEYKSVDVCVDMDCKHGTCIKEQDNTPQCVCYGCYIIGEDNLCSAKNENICNASYKRRCGESTGKGQCVPEEDETIQNGCKAVCQCVGAATTSTMCL